jgi:AraC-like DNA-binding protein
MQAIIIQNDTPRRLSNQQITDQLIETLFTGKYTFSQAAERVGIKRNRAYRLFNKWKETEEAKQIDMHWWALYLRLKDENPEKALECLTRLKYRMTTEKREVTKTVKEIRLEWQVEPETPNTVQTTPETIRIPP